MKVEISKEQKNLAEEKACKQYEEVIDSLVEFVKRATQEGASEKVVRVLPEVAAIVLSRI